MAEPVFAYEPVALAALDEHSLPSSDGKPMAENTRHARIVIHSANVAGERFAGRPDVLVAADLLLYYPSKPAAPSSGEAPPFESVAPDLFVVIGVSSRDRKSYVLWQERKAPAFALEVVSESSTKRDREEKKHVYESLGVAEYFVFDPDRSLEGFRLNDDGRYRPIPWTATGMGRDGLYSETLALFLFPCGPENELEWYDPATSEILRNYGQAEQGRRTAEEKAEQARAEAEQARAEAEAQVAKAEANLSRLQAENAELLALVRKLRDNSN